MDGLLNRLRAATAYPSLNGADAATLFHESAAELTRLRAACDALRASCVEALEHANFVDTPEGRDRANIGRIRGCLLTVRDILESALAAPRKEGERT